MKTIQLAALTCVAVAAVGANPASSAPGNKPNINYTQFRNEPSDNSSYRFEAGVRRAKGVSLTLRPSPRQGQVSGRPETLRMARFKPGPGADKPRPPQFFVVTSKNREEGCQRAAYKARGRNGTIDREIYRYCIFFPLASRTPTVTRWR